MNVIDIVILVFFGIGAYSGFKKGFILEIISLAAFFIAIILGIKLLNIGVGFVSKYVEGYDHILPVIVFTILFIGIIIFLNWIGKLLKRVLDMTLFGSIDDIIGAILGIVKWALVISIFFWIFSSFGGKFSSEMTSDSFLYDPVSSFAPNLFSMISSVFPFIEEFFNNSKEFIKEKEFTV
ncbi:MAG: membrane protein required for colicin V production [Cyclobacteriaceae bacterium]